MDDVIEILKNIQESLRPLDSIERRLRERFPTYDEAQQMGKELTEMLMKRSEGNVGDECL